MPWKYGILGKRIRIDVDGGDGVTINIKLEGDVSKEKLMQVYEMMEMLDKKDHAPAPSTVGAKIWYVIEKYFGYGNFTSHSILEKYEDEYNEPIKLSVISTYLARYADRMKLHRAKTGREWTYGMANQPAMRSSR